MKGCDSSINESGAVLVETAISLGLILFIIAGVSNLGSLIWETTLFTESNRSASRYSTMKFLSSQACGSSEQVYSDFITDEVTDYLQRYQENNFSSGKNSWNVQPQVNLQRVTWPRGTRGSSQSQETSVDGEIQAPDSIVFDYSVITISNIPDQACKFCSGLFRNIFSINTTSIFMLPCDLMFRPGSSNGNNGNGDNDEMERGA
jgi:hypothetical protein